MAKVGVFLPGLLGVSSTLGVECGVVLENTSFLRVSVVVRFLLLCFTGTDFLVFRFAQAVRDVRLRRKFCSFELKYL